MVKPLSKTPAGHHEIRARTLQLARPARTLLVLADGSRSREQLMKMVQGASPDDLSYLISAGMLTDAPEVPDELPARPEPIATATVEEPAETGLTYHELYDSLNALCKEQLGLFKGFRYSLEIEKADGVAGLREVAQRFVAEVQKTNGDTAAQMVRRALGLSR
jgi:hypothetical protein